MDRRARSHPRGIVSGYVVDYGPMLDLPIEAPADQGLQGRSNLTSRTHHAPWGCAKNRPKPVMVVSGAEASVVIGKPLASPACGGTENIGAYGVSNDDRRFALTGKVAVVTGSSRGIGTVRRRSCSARLGAKVVVSSRKAERLRAGRNAGTIRAGGRRGRRDRLQHRPQGRGRGPGHGRNQVIRAASTRWSATRP